jgi:hypothetical protein
MHAVWPLLPVLVCQAEEGAGEPGLKVERAKFF